MPPERRDFDPFVQSQHKASIAFGQVDTQMSDFVWDEGDGGSQEKQLDRVSQEDIISPEMQGLSELCWFKRDENNKKIPLFFAPTICKFPAKKY